MQTQYIEIHLMQMNHFIFAWSNCHLMKNVHKFQPQAYRQHVTANNKKTEHAMKIPQTYLDSVH